MDETRRLQVMEIVRRTRVSREEKFRPFADSLGQGLPDRMGYSHAALQAFETGKYLPSAFRLRAILQETRQEWVRQLMRDLLAVVEGK
jgi:transcriptional regulator with XRE-family HTH domain